MLSVRKPARHSAWQCLINAVTTSDDEYHIAADVGFEEVIEQPGDRLGRELLEGVEAQDDPSLTLAPGSVQGNFGIGDVIEFGDEGPGELLDRVVSLPCLSALLRRAMLV